MKYIKIENEVKKVSEEQFIELKNKKELERLNNLSYKEKRMLEYGDILNQLEFITENGLEAWQNKVREIKIKIPKPKVAVAE